MNVQDLIALAGGVNKLASALGIDHSTVSGWKRTGLIPAAHIARVSAVLNIAPDALLPLLTPPRRSRRAAVSVASPTTQRE